MKHDIYKLSARYHLNDNEQFLLDHLLEAAENRAHYAVRDFAARHFVSPASLIRLSKKLGYTGYTDMVYRLEFLVQNEIDNKALASDITSFIGEIPTACITRFTQLLAAHRHQVILVAGTGFCSPLRDFIARKMLVLGFQAIATNNYEVYEANALNAGLVLAISKSGATDTIVKPVCDAHQIGLDIVSFTGVPSSPIAQYSNPAFVLLDDKIMDDRNLTANYFYARVLILFEYLMDTAVDA